MRAGRRASSRRQLTLEFVDQFEPLLARECLKIGLDLVARGVFEELEIPRCAEE